MFLAKKVGDFNKKESESLTFIGLEIPRDYNRRMEAYAELYEKTDVLVVDAGKYGFVKLQYFNAEKGFDDAVSFLESKTSVLPVL